MSYSKTSLPLGIFIYLIILTSTLSIELSFLDFIPNYKIGRRSICRTTCITWEYPNLENHLWGGAKRKPKRLTYLVGYVICESKSIIWVHFSFLCHKTLSLQPKFFKNVREKGEASFCPKSNRAATYWRC